MISSSWHKAHQPTPLDERRVVTRKGRREKLSDMALPIVAIVGRPNVGKSTLVNRITQNDDAIVHEMRGVTRDRSYHRGDWNGLEFMVVDTGGIEIGNDDAFQAGIRTQALAAAEEADAIIFVVDSRVGVTTDDEEVARILRRTRKPVFLAVNKLDTPNRNDAIWEFMQLGLGEPWPISAVHGHGTGDLLDAVVAALRERGVESFEDEEEPAINVAIIGRPNAGKSSLTNCLCEANRAIVSDVAGTTRDAIDTLIRRDDVLYRIVDTAGIRRKSQIDEDVEYYGFVRAMRAIDRADVALLVIDASIGLTDQDQRVAGLADDRGCALVLVLNKWDLADERARKVIRERIEDRMTFVSYAPVVMTTALTGRNVDKVWQNIDEVFARYTETIPTSALNVWLSELREVGHTISKGKATLRMKYVTQTGTRPPQFTFFANRPDIVDDNYRRYLENRLRERFDLKGTPVRLRFKKKD